MQLERPQLATITYGNVAKKCGGGRQLKERGGVLIGGKLNARATNNKKYLNLFFFVFDK